mgnify:CR=1 FL=1
MLGRHLRTLDATRFASTLAILAGSGVPLRHAPSLPEAVTLAADLAQPGDAVLLSPACASFDMFRDYAHRAEIFTEAVSALAQQQGTILEGGV